MPIVSKQLNTSNDTIVWMENRKTSSIPRFRIKLLDYLYGRRILTLLSFFDDVSSFIRSRSIITSSTRASYRICRRWIESSSSEIWFRIFSSPISPPKKGFRERWSVNGTTEACAALKDYNLNICCYFERIYLQINKVTIKRIKIWVRLKKLRQLEIN